MVYTTPKVVYTTLCIYHGIYKQGHGIYHGIYHRYIPWYIPLLSWYIPWYIYWYIPRYIPWYIWWYIPGYIPCYIYWYIPSSFNGIYYDIYHGIYHDLTDTYHLTLQWLQWTACSHLLRPTACYSYCILSPGTPQRSGLCLMNISQAGLQTGAVASCMWLPVRMRRQCDVAASATRQGCVQSISGAPSRKPNTVSLMQSISTSASSVWSNSCTVIAATSSWWLVLITVCVLAAGEKLEVAWMAQSCEQLEMLRHNGLESCTTFLTIVSFARRQVENPLATGQNVRH